MLAHAEVVSPYHANIVIQGGVKNILSLFRKAYLFGKPYQVYLFLGGELPCPSWMKPPGTVVLIAHRLSTVINATQICVIHKGLIVEKGTHDELVAQGGVYAQLVSRQLSRDASAVMGEKKAKDAKKTNQSLVIFIGLRECLQETLNCMF